MPNKLAMEADFKEYANGPLSPLVYDPNPAQVFFYAGWAAAMKRWADDLTEVRGEH